MWGKSELNCSLCSGLFLDGGVEMARGRASAHTQRRVVAVAVDRDSFPFLRCEQSCHGSTQWFVLLRMLRRPKVLGMYCA